jgi:acetolactate synthase-1/2/3 large subunit
MSRTPPADVNARPGSALLAESLLRAGVDTLFGVAGDTGVSFYDALYTRSHRITHVLANDERGAAFMADVYARRTNRIGVVEVSSGGGATFVVGGLGEAFAASVPILLISTDIHRSSRGTGALTEIDQEALYSAVTKWRATVKTAAEIPALLGQAVASALTGRPGPVALIIPEDVLDERGASEAWPSSIELPPERPAATPAELSRLLTLLRGSRRPAILAGSGIHLSQAHEALQRFVERCGIPVATTIHGKGALAETSPWSLGAAGANGARGYANEYLAEADLVIFIGTRANSTDTNGFTAPPRDSARIVHVDIDPTRAGHNYPGSLSIVADARKVLEQALQSLDWTPAAPELAARRAWIEERRQLWERAWSIRPPPTSELPGVLDPWQVLRTICDVAGGQVTIVADAGTPTPYLTSGWESDQPGRRLILPRGHGPMGYALPGALGAAIADRSPVIGVITDGSLLMACGALETAARMRLPVTYVLLTNGAFGWMKALQRLYFGGRYFATDLSVVDGAAIATGFGLEACRAADCADLSNAIRRGLQRRTPNLIEVRVPSEHEMLPPVAPWQSAAEGQETGRPVY